MSLMAVLFGRRLASDEEEKEQIGPLSGIPVLGLDALASASYGPEAALTVLLPLGALGVHYIVPLSALVIGLLAIVYVSYRQTITAYPSGGGSYIVAKENLGTRAGLVAAAALLFDYVLNVAVAISAGVGALVSVVPALLPHTLGLCLAVLTFLTAANSTRPAPRPRPPRSSSSSSRSSPRGRGSRPCSCSGPFSSTCCTTTRHRVLKWLLLFRGGKGIVIVNTPFYLPDAQEAA
ncbi:hypothetical protein WMF45_40145 [Sorangium sp. So ce448]